MDRMKYGNGASPALDIRHLWAGYGRNTALEDVNLQVPSGSILGIIGPNGSGKSTLLKVVLGLLSPWRGQVSVFGRPSSVQRALLGYMPQMELVDWDFPVTVGDVALMGRYGRLGLLRRPGKADRQAAEEALDRVGMAGLRKRLIGELSGGQRRRVLLARALADDPRLLLLDEPLSGLDATSQHQLLDVLRGLQAQDTSVVMTTHDLSCVSSACHHAACLNRYVVAYGTPDEVLTERVLSETFGTHLLMVHLDGQAYAYQHHQHDSGQEAAISDQPSGIGSRQSVTGPQPPAGEDA